MTSIMTTENAPISNGQLRNHQSVTRAMHKTSLQTMQYERKS